MMDMESENNRDQSLSPFIPNRPLVGDMNNEFIYQLSAEDVSNDYIEEHYGPFETQKSYPSPVPDLSAMFSPRLSSKYTRVDLEKQLREIELLKKTILKKEQLALEKKLSEEQKTTNSDSEKDQDISQNQQEIQELIVEKDEKIMNLNSFITPEDTEGGSGSDMDISDTEDVQSPINYDNDDTMDLNNDDDMYDSDSDSSYFTAVEEISEEAKMLNEMEYGVESLEAAITRLEDKLNIIKDKDKNIELRLSYIKVKMSMEKNKNTKKPIQPKSSGIKRAAPNVYSPPYKRVHTEINAINSAYQQPTYPYQFYPQQMLPPAMNHYQANMTTSFPPPFMQYPIPPPPPPSELPPPISSPPPPPPQSLTTIVNNIESLDLATINSRAVTRQTPRDTENLRAAIKEIQDLVHFRLADNKSEHPVITNRPLPRPRRLITVDNYTVTMNMVFLDKELETAGQIQENANNFTLPAGHPAPFTMTDIDYDSPLSVVLYRKAQNKSFSPLMESAMLTILISIPSHVDLSTFHMMRLYPEQLQNTYNLISAFNHDYPQNHFLTALKLELSLYVHGPESPQFLADYEESTQRLPTSVDVHWQYIIEQTDYKIRLQRFKQVLKVIESKSPKNDQKDLANLSSITVELLTRLIRMGGLKDALKIVTGNDTFEINTIEPAIFPINEGSELLEEDIYYFWMLALHYQITNKLPSEVCELWMRTLVREGKPNITKVMFMIDWTDVLKDQPLDQATLTGATNTILSMLSYFTKSTCDDITKKPLLIGVLRTFITFLSCSPHQSITSTYLLVKKLEENNILSPEIKELVTDLELKMECNLKTVVVRLFDECKKLPSGQAFTLAYRFVCMFCEHINYTTENIVLIACVLSIPLGTSNSNRDEVENIILNSIKSVDYEGKVTMVKGITSQYRNLAGVGANGEILPNTEISRKSAFLWINILLLYRICGLLCPNQKDDLLQALQIDFKTGLKYVPSYDARMLLYKYSTELVEGFTN